MQISVFSFQIWCHLLARKDIANTVNPFFSSFPLDLTSFDPVYIQSTFYDTIVIGTTAKTLFNVILDKGEYIYIFFPIFGKENVLSHRL